MFFKCKTIEECKILFKRLAKRLHPDLGGEHDLMILLQEDHANYLHWLEISNNWKVEPPKNTNYKPQPKCKTKSKKKPKAKPKPEPEVRREIPPWDGIFMNVVEDVFKGDPRLSIIDLILVYASKNPTFKTDFTKSIVGFLAKKDYITSSQYNTLVKIYFSFRMDEKEEEELKEAEKENVGEGWEQFS